MTNEEMTKIQNQYAMAWYLTKEKYEPYFFLPTGNEFNNMFDKLYTENVVTGDAYYYGDTYVQELAKEFNLEESEAKIAYNIFLDVINNR